MIQKGLEEIEFLQRRVMEISKVLNLKPEDIDLTIEYLHTVYACVDKEHIMYTRLELCDNIEAKQFKEQLDREADRAGMPKEITVPEYCNQMKEEIKRKLSQLGQELNEELDIDFFS